MWALKNRTPYAAERNSRKEAGRAWPPGLLPGRHRADDRRANTVHDAPIHYEWAFGGTDTAHPDPRKQGIDARNPVDIQTSTPSPRAW
jgi:hypothetical protein